MIKYNKLSCLLLVFIPLLTNNNLVQAQEKVIPLWTYEIPGAVNAPDHVEEIKYEGEEIRSIGKVSVPSLTAFVPAEGNANGSSVIICPGGGYRYLSINKEGYRVAEWFAERGITAFVLKNRLPSEEIMTNKSIGPLQDAQRAIRLVRENAEQWNLDTTKVGIMGFSAGGHLAASAATLFNERTYSGDVAVSARPDFSVLIYPVISMDPDITHNGSRINLLGDKPSDEAISKFSAEEQVTEKTPTAFLVHATDDVSVPVENSLRYFLALKEYRVPVEMHIYQDGGHGFGMGRGLTSDSWPEALELWMKKHGYIQ